MEQMRISISMAFQQYYGSNAVNATRELNLPLEGTDEIKKRWRTMFEEMLADLSVVLIAGQRRSKKKKIGR